MKVKQMINELLNLPMDADVQFGIKTEEAHYRYFEPSYTVDYENGTGAFISRGEIEDSQPLNSRELMLAGANEIIRSLNNEVMIDPWLSNGVPDGADIEEIKEMANDDDEFTYCMSLFLDIIRFKSAWHNGICVGNLPLITERSRV